MNFFAFLANLLESFCTFPTDLNLDHSDGTLKGEASFLSINKNMLHFKGKATFKCKQCGHKFEAFDTEGGFKAGPNLPCCPKCGSSKTRKTTLLERIL